jgi:hypothetical protein
LSCDPAKTEAVHENLPLVEWTEIAGLRIAETDDAQELVFIAFELQISNQTTKRFVS